MQSDNQYRNAGLQYGVAGRTYGSHLQSLAMRGMLIIAAMYYEAQQCQMITTWYGRLSRSPSEHAASMVLDGIPAYKVIPKTGFVVDAFVYKNPDIKAYFLSHAHAGK